MPFLPHLLSQIDLNGEVTGSYYVHIPLLIAQFATKPHVVDSIA